MVGKRREEKGRKGHLKQRAQKYKKTRDFPVAGYVNDTGRGVWELVLKR